MVIVVELRLLLTLLWHCMIRSSKAADSEFSVKYCIFAVDYLDYRLGH